MTKFDVISQTSLGIWLPRCDTTRGKCSDDAQMGCKGTQGRGVVCDLNGSSEFT